jgi:hypothetical protein
MTEFDIVDEINRETAELLADNPDAVIAWQPDGDGAYRLEPRDD